MFTLKADTFNATSLATLALIKAETDDAISGPGSRFSLSLFPSSLSLSSPFSVFLYLNPLSLRSSLARIYPRWSRAFVGRQVS